MSISPTFRHDVTKVGDFYNEGLWENFSFFVGSSCNFVSGCIKNVDTHHESFSLKKQVIKKLSPKSLWQTCMKWTVSNCYLLLTLLVLSYLGKRDPLSRYISLCFLIRSMISGFTISRSSLHPIIYKALSLDNLFVLANQVWGYNCFHWKQL